jgi:DNA polymerase-3 subunit gamma/tau
MTYQVLARKWRPQTFDDMVGQHHVLVALKNALDSDRLHHAYLFTGTRGVGKTTLARILAKCLNCEKGVSSTPCGTCSACTSIDSGRFVDLIEVDAASRAKVEETRDLMDNVQYSPSTGRYKVYLIDEVHMFSNHSFNALLKTLEEPPPHVKFLLATTEPKKLPVTILSRCLQFNLKHLTREQIAGQLKSITEKEQINTDDESLRLIASAANGSMRDALSLLDQAIPHGSGELKQETVRDMLGTIHSQDLLSLYQALINDDATALINCINKMDEHTPDYDAVFAEILSDFHDMAICHAIGSGADTLTDIKHEICQLAEQIDKEDVQLYYQIALTGRRDLPMSPDPRIGFEMTMVRMLAFRPDTESGGQERKTVKKVSISEKTEVSTAAPEPAEIAIGQDWKNLIDDMALTGLVRELAGNCVLKDHTKERIHLVLLPTQEHLLKTIQQERLQAAIHERFGKDVKLVITVEEPRGETPKQVNKRMQDERQQQAIDSFNDDPDVKDIVDAFNATIEQDTIRPQ